MFRLWGMSIVDLHSAKCLAVFLNRKLQKSVEPVVETLRAIAGTAALLTARRATLKPEENFEAKESFSEKRTDKHRPPQVRS
jgi:hypothetical protein